MNVRTAIARAARSARLTAVGWGILTILVSAGVSACTSSPSSTPPAVFSPSVTGSPGTATQAARAASSSSPSNSASAAPAVAAPPPETPSPSYSSVPPAPATGGGGTAGLQDAVLFGLGAAAILAGAGSIIYRRKLTKDR